MSSEKCISDAIRCDELQKYKETPPKYKEPEPRGIDIPKGGILTSRQIKRMVNEKTILIENFDETHLGPNSYDMCISDELEIVIPNASEVWAGCERRFIDPSKPQKTEYVKIFKSGYVLEPNILYLARTRDRINTNVFIPIIYGRSSCGRMGISCYQTGNLGDLGYDGVLTLQLSVIYPTIIYPFSYLCQVAFETPYGLIDKRYNGKYQHSDGIAKAKVDTTICSGN